MKDLKLYIIIFLLLISGDFSSTGSVNIVIASSGPGNPDISQVNNNQNIKTSNGAKLPVIITPARSLVKDAPAALIISGDGGWYKFEQSIADKLADRGIGTIGLDTKKYFWNRRTPEETTADINACLEYYGREWNKENFVIVGYSLGAEIVPFIINRLPVNMRSRISMLVLLSPAETTDFEVHIADMVGIGNRKNTYRVIEEINKIKGIPSLLIFGSDEKSKVPELLKGTSVMIAVIPGDHHYKFNTSLIVETMKNHKAF